MTEIVGGQADVKNDPLLHPYGNDIFESQLIKFFTEMAEKKFCRVIKRSFISCRKSSMKIKQSRSLEET